MPRTLMVVLGAVTLIVGSGLAVQDVMTEEEYQAAMTEIGLLVGDAELHIDARYWPELNEDLDKMTAQFDKVEAFWAARGTEEAVTLTQAVVSAMAPIREAASGRDPGAASDGVDGLRSACQACHDQYREGQPGAYRIRQ